MPMAGSYLAALSTPTSVSWLAYIVIGGIAGWLAIRIMNRGASGILLNIVIGVIGGFLGGMLLGWFGVDVEHGRRWFTFFVSLGGAIVLLWIVGLVRRT
ncbi:GlsB/YeaQ/YmgE family stress response membrane protein [Mycolicibacter terrae]|uniref:GlsB/YeaQ/YmgE family stress response membrane protein n=1 Tax=Mycolicibacter terrae TaxID=1788 RepID=A0ACD2ESJ5_9MYCO|nr:GlsB/YeaQ/YmgE family stress response membrane protein [Mycolicibacter terrae]RRR48118.1 GlsB/YeaQ/YmgE family stress response membrane protein [Mycolicibacter terrae]